MKRINVTKHVSKCGVSGCGSTAGFQVSYRDPAKPGRVITGTIVESTRTSYACTAEHALFLIGTFLVEEGEIGVESQA